MDEQGAGEKRYALRENAARPLSSPYPSDTRAFWVGKAQDLPRELSTNCFSFRKRIMVLQVGKFVHFEISKCTYSSCLYDGVKSNDSRAVWYNTLRSNQMLSTLREV
jgi:hypothetical protein